MNKKKIKRHNINANYFLGGGPKGMYPGLSQENNNGNTGSSWNEDFNKVFSLKDTFSGENTANLLGGAVSALGSFAGQKLSGGMTSGAGTALQGLGTVAAAIPGPWGAIASTGLNLAGAGANALFGSKLNEENINQVKSDNAAMRNVVVGSDSTEDVLNQYKNQNFGEDFSQSYIGDDGPFSHKARDLYNELKREREFNLGRTQRAYWDANEAYKLKRQQDMMANFAAFGGPIEMRTEAPMSPFGNRFSMGGGIHIKKENRGKFTDYCGGKVTTECINRGKNSPNPLTRKRAIFAANARNWHSEGGPLFTNGAEFSNGLTYIGNGGTHEENPFEGVPMGVDQQGNPNLVEGGEYIWNTKDYVFSDRLKVPKAVRNMYKLRGTKDLTFADAVKQLQKESEERPNDPISKRGLEDSLMKLAMVQEAIRQEDMMNNNGNIFATGGGMPEGYLPFSNKRAINDRPTYIIFNDDGTVDWESTYNKDSDFMKRRQYMIDNWDTVRNDYIKMLNENTGKDFSNLTLDEYKKFTQDRKLGFMHRVPGLDNIKVAPSVVKTPTSGGIPDLLRRPEDIDPNAPIFDWNKEGKEYLDNTTSSSPRPNLKEDTPKDSPLRYASALGPALGLGVTLANKPDYSRMETIMENARNIRNYPRTKAHTISNYLTYNPFDTEYYAAQNKAQQAAALRALENNSIGNRANAQAGILAANYAGQLALGDIYRKAEEYNQAQREKIEGFNRATNQFNAEQLQKADAQNQSAFLSAMGAAADLDTKALAGMDAIDAARNAAISSGIQGIFENLGNIGIDTANRNTRNWEILHGNYGVTPKKAKGGKINRRKKGLTY